MGTTRKISHVAPTWKATSINQANGRTMYDRDVAPGQDQGNGNPVMQPFGPSTIETSVRTLMIANASKAIGVVRRSTVAPSG